MTATIEWTQIAIRIGATAIASAAIGFERERRNRPAGLRTTLLVGLAACFAMIQANMLLSVRGKAADSYVVLDLMRLPLGILSGMGFIGAGAIVRKKSGVAGVTTAATLWFVTVMGLCFGGGQIKLGLCAAGLGIFVLHGLRWLEFRSLHRQSATLRLRVNPDGPSEELIAEVLCKAGYHIDRWSFSCIASEQLRSLKCHVYWQEPMTETRLPDFLRDLAGLKGVITVSWNR